jgi:hypothetical protein
MISDGWSAGGAEIKIPKEEKQKAAIIVPITKEKVIISAPNKKTLTSNMIDVISTPNKTEPIISPKRIAHKEIGDDTNLSKVFILVSQGAMTGVMAETAKNKAIPSNPGIKSTIEISLLKKKAINIKAGISKP